MKQIPETLRFTAEQDALICFQAAKAAAAGFTASRRISYRLTDSLGNVIMEDRASYCALPIQAGDWRLTLLADDGGEADLRLLCADGVLPYLMPGVGVLWQHGAIFPLLLAKEQAHIVYLLASPAEKTDAVAVIKGIDFGEDAEIHADGQPFAGDWYPKLGRSWFWHSAMLPEAVCTKFTLPRGSRDIRFTVYNRTVAALAEPAQDFVWGQITPSVTDGEGNPIDARLEVYIGETRVAMDDRFAEEGHPLYLPQGKYTLRASHGILWSEAETEIIVTDAPQSVTLTLTEQVRLPAGWMAGELHTHSSLEDATLFPRQVMRAARVNGRNFCFMTDKDIDHLERFGLHECDLPGRFLALPGQEIMCHELHTNVLNPAYRIENPEADDLNRVNPDIDEKIAGWLSQVKGMKKKQPCMIMHNHPSHRPEVAQNGQPYFRSWWVSDLFPEYSLVENCDYAGWFDRLNRGRILYAAWTGDGHDCTLMYPGKEGVIVNTGGELSAEAILRALENGRFFSCRAPGMVLLTEAAERAVKVYAEAASDIDRVEVIADGRVVKTIPGNGRTLSATVPLPDDIQWCIARAKLKTGQWNRDTHSFTPFMEAGYDAFTNPLFFG